MPAVAGGSGITLFLFMTDGIEDFNLTILYGNRRGRCITSGVPAFVKEKSPSAETDGLL